MPEKGASLRMVGSSPLVSPRTPSALQMSEARVPAASAASQRSFTTVTGMVAVTARLRAAAPTSSEVAGLGSGARLARRLWAAEK